MKIVLLITAICLRSILGFAFSLGAHELTHFHQESRDIIVKDIDGFSKPFTPVKSLNVMGEIFHFSKIFKSPDFQHRDYALMYAKNNGLLVPRFLYKSRSDGGWRVCPEIWFDSSFSKGKKIHYTQETKPIEEIVALLEVMEDDGKFQIKLDLAQCKLVEEALFPFFWLLSIPGASKAKRGKPRQTNSNEESTYTFDKEVTGYETKTPLLKQFTDCPPGASFDRSSNRLGRSPSEFYAYFRNLEYPSGFIPNFSLPPTKNYPLKHTMLGQINVLVYLSKLDDEVIEWHMAYDREGRVWIDRINFLIRSINSYGLASVVINSGLLTNKPLEHRAQAYYLTKDDESITQDDSQALPY